MAIGDIQLSARPSISASVRISSAFKIFTFENFHQEYTRRLAPSDSAFGNAHKNGYQIALDEINAKGGILGKKLELDVYDDQSKPDQAVQGVSKLVDQDHVSMLLGAYSSENTKAILGPVMTHQIPLIIPTATADNVMDSKSPWMCRICAGANDYAKATIDFLKNNGNPKTIAIVYENTHFGQCNKDAMETVAKAP